MARARAGACRRWPRGRMLVAVAAGLAVVGPPAASLRPTADASTRPSSVAPATPAWLPGQTLLPAAAAPASPVFDDEFDGPAGAAPNPQLWQMQTGKGIWGGGQMQDYTSNPDNVSLDGHGHLVITARRGSGVNDYTSGRILSLLPIPPHGHFEARIKMPAGYGLWPCFWLVGVEPSGVTWPYGGEIDIAEMTSRLPSVQYATVHGPRVTPGPDTRLSPSKVAVDRHWYLTKLLHYGKPITGAFHTFAVDSSPGKLIWSFDGVPYLTVTKYMVPSGALWPFDDVKFFLILNLAVGGPFPGDPQPSTPFPASMVVDYVRVTSSS